MATTYESVEELAEALRRAAAAHGMHEEHTARPMRTGPIGTRSTWCGSAPARSCRHEQRL